MKSVPASIGFAPALPPAATALTLRERIAGKFDAAVEQKQAFCNGYTLEEVDGSFFKVIGGLRFPFFFFSFFFLSFL